MVTDRLPSFHAEWSGAEQVCFRLSQLLKEKEQTVTFITTKLKKKRVSNEIYQIPSLLPYFESNAPTSGLRYFLKLFPIEILALLHSVVTLKKMKPDIVHLHSKILSFPVLISAKILKIPVVLTVLDHEVICPMGNLMKPDGAICTSFHGSQCVECFPKTIIPSPMQKIAAHCRSLIFDYFLRKLDSIVALTRSSRTLLEHYGLPSEKIRVIYHYKIDFKRKNLMSRVPKEPTILFVGWLRPYKGLHVVIQAMQYIIKEVPRARLLVIGSVGPRDYPEYETKIKNMIENLKLEGHVFFLGKRKHEEVMELLAESNVLVVPEQWPNTFGPVILVEAMSLAKPVVASNIGGIPEFIKNDFNGFLVTHNQPNQFADKVIWLLQHEKSARRMGENAKNSIKFLHEEKPIEKIMGLYRSLTVATKNRGHVLMKRG